MSLFGRDITRLGAPHRTRLGLGRAFQLINLYPSLTVFENVRLAVQSVAQIRFDILSIAARNTVVRDEARHWLDRVKLTARAGLTVGRCRTAISASWKWRSCSRSSRAS